jgi:hypothetical protein
MGAIVTLNEPGPPDTASCAVECDVCGRKMFIDGLRSELSNAIRLLGWFAHCGILHCAKCRFEATGMIGEERHGLRYPACQNNKETT